MEQDNGSPEQYQALVRTTIPLSLAASLGETNQAVRTTRLTDTIRDNLNGIDLPIPFALDDDHIGTQQLILDRSDIFVQGAKNKVMIFDTSEGRYELVFRVAGETGWSGWESLGGTITTAPVPVSWGPGHLDVFARGGDNALWHKWWTGKTWSGWESLGGTITTAPVPVSWGPGHLDVFARGGDNALWHKWWTGKTWSGWESLGGTITTAPVPVSWGPGHLDVFARGGDNALWHKWWTGKTWSGWESLGGTITTAPVPVSWGPGHLDVFARGGDNALWHRFWRGL
ncbi:DUF346 domain-containing protein [Nocardia vinacea]|uniref:hypothetical protein n=1 Tax=Nocardia vinacea TaxID=96468 RepID=UPI002E10F61C|nr:DUF346 domain-containing protein [Nocardia vinacea]